MSWLSAALGGRFTGSGAIFANAGTPDPRKFENIANNAANAAVQAATRSVMTATHAATTTGPLASLGLEGNTPLYVAAGVVLYLLLRKK